MLIVFVQVLVHDHDFKCIWELKYLSMLSADAQFKYLFLFKSDSRVLK